MKQVGGGARQATVCILITLLGIFKQWARENNHLIDMAIPTANFFQFKI